MPFYAYMYIFFTLSRIELHALTEDGAEIYEWNINSLSKNDKSVLDQNDLHYLHYYFQF